MGKQICDHGIQLARIVIRQKKECIFKKTHQNKWAAYLYAQFHATCWTGAKAQRVSQMSSKSLTNII